MQKELNIDDIMQYSQIISIVDGVEPLIKNKLSKYSSSSIVIDVLLMLLCEHSERIPSPEEQDLNLD